MKLKLLIALALAMLTTTATFGRDVTVVWDPPTPEDAPRVEGYNVYEITFVPPVLPPGPSALANITSPVAGSVSTVRKLNTAPIPAGTHEFTITDVRDGLQTIVRAFNFQGESPDSDVLTLIDPPKKPGGLKVAALVIEQSSNLKTWSTLGVIAVTADVASQFFRLALNRP